MDWLHFESQWLCSDERVLRCCFFGIDWQELCVILKEEVSILQQEISSVYDNETELLGGNRSWIRCVRLMGETGTVNPPSLVWSQSCDHGPVGWPFPLPWSEETVPASVERFTWFQAIMHHEGHMDDGLTLSRSQHEESRTARVIRSTVFLFNRFIRWADLNTHVHLDGTLWASMATVISVYLTHTVSLRGWG